MASVDICLRLKNEFDLINTDYKFHFTFKSFSYPDNYSATVLCPTKISNMVIVATNCYINTDGKLICTRFVTANYNDAYHYLSFLQPKAIKLLETHKKNFIADKLNQINKDFI